MSRKFILPSVLAALGLACSGQGPTGPDAADAHVTLSSVNLTAPQMDAAQSLWNEQVLCMGYHDNHVETVKLTVYKGAFLCGGTGGGTAIWAAGCTNPGRIEVAAPWFENALSHEYIHMIGLLRGEAPDYTHSGPQWAQCDGRNR